MNALIDKKTKKVIDFFGTDRELKMVENIPEQPKPKAGVNFVKYYDEATGGIVYKEETRELSESEKILQSINDINLALAEIMAGEEAKADEDEAI